MLIKGGADEPNMLSEWAASRQVVQCEEMEIVKGRGSNSLMTAER